MACLVVYVEKNLILGCEFYMGMIEYRPLSA